MGFKGILGHEFVGRVISAPDKEWEGKRVTGDINLACTACDVCYLRNDRSRNHCPKRTVLGILGKDGTMAEYLTLPLRNLHIIPDSVSDEEAVFVEPLAAACRITEQGLVKTTDKVAILGDGKLGLMCAEVLGRHGCNHRPILFGKHKDKMSHVSELVDTRLVSEAQGEGAEVHRGSFDVVVDATGNPNGMKLASELCRPMGILVLKSTCAMGESFNAAPFVIDELKIVGSRCGPFPKAIELLKEHKLNLSKYLTRTFKLADAEEAIKYAAQRSTMKVQLMCE